MACLFGHKWNGCKCEKCGKERPHEWRGRCKCSICGAVRDEGHDYREYLGYKCISCGKECQHEWENCKCKICGKRRPLQDEGHNWNGCKCKYCVATRDVGHSWNGCKCSVCGKTRDEGHSLNDCGDCIICGETIQDNHKWEYSTIYVGRGDDAYFHDTTSCKKCGRPKSEIKYFRKDE